MNSGNRFATMAKAYDQTVQSLLPMYDFLQGELIELLGVHAECAFQLVDLGGGSGIFSKKILERFPNAKVTLIDSSPAFLRVASEKLAPFDENVILLESDIESPWELQLKSSPDFIVSMSTIHHLPSDRKRAIYQRAYECLKYGGKFFNMDEMETLYPDAYRNSLLRWDKHVAQFYENLSETNENIAAFREWEPYYKDWRTRNILCEASSNKSAGDDLHDPFVDQMQWLKECGFQGVDIFVKYHLWCIIGGTKG